MPPSGRAESAAAAGQREELFDSTAISFNHVYIMDISETRLHFKLEHKLVVNNQEMASVYLFLLTVFVTKPADV